MPPTIEADPASDRPRILVVCEGLVPAPASGVSELNPDGYLAAVSALRAFSKAAGALDAEAAGDPLAMARLQTILGNTLRDLGSYAKAVDLLEKARRIRERELGADHPHTLAALANLALAYQLVGKLSEAITLSEQVRDAQVRKLGVDDPTTLITLNSLAFAYRAVGKLPEALALSEQVRDAAARRWGPTTPTLSPRSITWPWCTRTSGNCPRPSPSSSSPFGRDRTLVAKQERH
jgi:hypothetical protein